MALEQGGSCFRRAQRGECIETLMECASGKVKREAVQGQVCDLCGSGRWMPSDLSHAT